MTTQKITLALTVNGRVQTVAVEPRKLLSDVLREELGLTGTHVGCEQGVCGACTVLIDGRPARACLCFAAQADGRAVTTVEALAHGGDYNALQQAMEEEHGVQCGFCTPGILMTFEAYLAEDPDPDEARIREVLSGNLCRCTGYESIVRAVRKAAVRRRGNRND